MRIDKLILVCSIVSALFLASCNNKPATPKISKVQAPPKINTEQLEKQEIESLLKELKQKNPFRPDHSSGTSIEVKGETDLKGIIWDIQRPFALIGNRVVVEGDTVDSKKVMKINKDSVVLDNQGKEEILRLELTPQVK